ncbi:MAG: transcriptional repressor [Cytophagales bacterium]|nr:MAG: transcriptional repressor [Cytophagales bacterium]
MLTRFKLRHTQGRIDILMLFNQFQFALSNADIEENIGAQYDRVTIYRTLKTFLDKGLIHKVLDDSGILKYALCSHDCHEEEGHHHHQHVHFKCIGCGQTNCLEHVEIPNLLLPEGYKAEEANLLISGTCKACNEKPKK